MSTPRFASSLGWQTANVATQVILQLVFMAVLARLIAPEAFGLMAIALVVVGFVEIFAQVGIGPSVVHKSDLTPTHLRSAFVFSLVLGVVFFCGMYAAAPAVANFYGRDDLASVLRVISLSFILSGAAVVPRSLLVKQMAFKKLFIAAVVAMIVGNWAIGLGLAWNGYGVWAYVGALLSQNAILGLLYWFFAPVPVGFRWDGVALREMLGYGGRSTAFNIFTYAAGKVDTLIVGRWGSGWAATGIYDRSVYLMGLPVTVLGKLSDSVLFSGMSAQQNDLPALRKTARSAAMLLAIAVLPGTTLLVLCASEFTLLFLGPQYTEAVPLVSILFLAIPARGLIKLGDAIVRATDNLKSAITIKAVYLAAIAGSTWGCLESGWDLQAVAWGIVGATWLQLILFGILSVKITGLEAPNALKALVPGLLSALAVGAASASWLWSMPEASPVVRLAGALVLAAGAFGILAWRNRRSWFGHLRA